MTIDKEYLTMPEADSLFSSSEFTRWFKQVQSGLIAPVAGGNQGKLWRYQSGGHDLAVKRCTGGWLIRRLNRRSLKNEYRAYQRLRGLSGVPACYGMPDRNTLVLEFVTGVAYRHAELANRKAWFEALRELISDIHSRGVGHGDLKRKENLLAGADGQPYVLDFGTAWLLRPGWRPINRWLFLFSCKLDNNAIIKHKYHGDYDQVKGPDLAELNYTWPERLWRWLRPRLGIK